MRGFSVLLGRELPDYTWEGPDAIRAAYSVPTALKKYLKQL